MLTPFGWLEWMAILFFISFPNRAYENYFYFLSLIFWFSEQLRFVKQSVVKFAGLVNTSSLLNPEPSFTGEDFTKHFYNCKVKT
jgi:hypothetical protein